MRLKTFLAPFLDEVPGAEKFGHAPGLGDAAPGGVRWVSVEDLTDAPDAVIREMIEEGLQEGASLNNVVVNP